jgi:hypothetical protein
MRMRAWIWIAATLLIGAVTVAGGRSAEPQLRKPVAAGNLTVNPNHLVAVFRPVEHQSVTVLVGRAGQAVQVIQIQDGPEATAVFESLWKNDKLTKDPGETDARPLTRMMTREADQAGALPALVVNVERVLAIKWDPNRRVANVYFDLPAPVGDEGEGLEIPNDRGQAEAVVAAYKACVLAARGEPGNK